MLKTVRRTANKLQVDGYLMLKTVRGAVNINYRWILIFKTVRGAANINYRWTPYV